MQELVSHLLFADIIEQISLGGAKEGGIGSNVHYPRKAVIITP